ADPLALVEGLACAVAKHHRIKPTNTRNSLTTRRKARPEQTGKAGQTSRCHAPLNDNQDHKKSVRPNHGPSVDRGLERWGFVAFGAVGVVEFAFGPDAACGVFGSGR